MTTHSTIDPSLFNDFIDAQLAKQASDPRDESGDVVVHADCGSSSDRGE